jgi:hypothetical protein
MRLGDLLEESNNYKFLRCLMQLAFLQIATNALMAKFSYHIQTYMRVQFHLLTVETFPSAFFYCDQLITPTFIYAASLEEIYYIS